MATVVRPRRHSLSNPLVLCGLPQAPVPFEDVRFPHLCRRKRAAPRKDPPSPVDSLLSPDFRFPQGEAEVLRLVHDRGDDAANGRRQRSKSVGARPSGHASPSLEDVRDLLSLTEERHLSWPLAPAPTLVAAYGEFIDGLQGLRKGCLTRKGLVQSRAGPGLRGLVRAARAAELALLPVVFPASPLGPDGAASAPAADRLAPAVAQQLAVRVKAAATALGRVRGHLDRWQARYGVLCVWQDRVEAYVTDAECLPLGFDRSTLLMVLEMERAQAFEELVDRVLPRHTHSVHARAQDVCEFLRRKGLYHEAEPAMSGALPKPVPGEDEPPQREAGDASQQQEAGDQPKQHEVKQHGEECADASPGPKDATSQADTNDATPRHPGATLRCQRLRWAYLRLRYGSRHRWRRINHAVALDAFLEFQQDLRASMAVAAAGEDPIPAAVRLYDKAEAWAHWHALQLSRDRSSSSSEDREEEEEEDEEEDEEDEEEDDEEEEEEDDKTAIGVVPSIIDVLVGDGDDDGWAAQVSKSLRRVRSSITSHSEEEMMEGKGQSRSSSRSPRQTTHVDLDGTVVAAPDGSKRDSGVIGCVTPTPADEASASCVDLMQQAGTITQRRRQDGKGVAGE